MLCTYAAVPCKNYSIAYFDYITVFKSYIGELASKAGLIHTRCLRINEACMSPALNGSLAVQHFKRSNAVKIHDRIILDFHTGLPHMYIWGNFVLIYIIIKLVYLWSKLHFTASNTYDVVLFTCSPFLSSWSQKSAFKDATCCLFIFDMVHFNGETLMDK